jgi:hypothetical protein
MVKNGRVEHQRIEIIADRLGAQADPCQDEGKLADLEQAKANGQRDDVAVAEQFHQPCEDQAFADDYEQDQQYDLPDMGNEERGVEEHAHRHEEQQAKDIAQGNDVAEGLVAVFRLTEDHAGDKGPEGKGKPEKVSDIPHSETDGGHREEKEFAGVPGGDVREEPRDDPGADHDHQGDEDCGFQGGPGDKGYSCLGRAELRQDDHQRDDRQILDNQHADHHPARQGAHKSTGHQGLEDDHGAGQGDDRAEPQ